MSAGTDAGESIDPVELSRRLIRQPTVTPNAAASIDCLQALLNANGFVCTRTDRSGIANLHARWGHASPVIAFAGHLDVVPPGDPRAWTADPFSADERDGALYGRGACDMKSAVAAFVSAAVSLSRTNPGGSIVLLLTGDEEGDGIDGTDAILDWMETAGETIDACVVGEPTCPDRMGEMIKIGRRGSMTAWIEATGRQGHSAYPHLAANPIHALVTYLSALTAVPLDTGTEHFDPTTLQITGIDAGNTSNNVIPGACTAIVNIRFNDVHSGESLSDWLREEAGSISADTGVAIDMTIKISGESFVTPPGPLSDLVSSAVEAEVGTPPVLSTSGGTSDARFIRRLCPVVECGLVNRTMHQTDERVEVDQIRQLTRIYERIIEGFLT